jgi:hypothetical protein
MRKIAWVLTVGLLPFFLRVELLPILFFAGWVVTDSFLSFLRVGLLLILYPKIIHVKYKA